MPISSHASASTSSSAVPAAPAQPLPGLAQFGLRGSPFRKLARKRDASEIPDVPVLPAFADVSADALPPPVVPPAEAKLDMMFEFMRENMATKSDLVNLQNTIELRTKAYVDSAMRAVTHEFSYTTQAVVELTQRVERLEKRSASVPPKLGSRNGDIGFKQIAFRKIPTGVSAEQRLKDIESFMATNFTNVRVRDCFNIYRGAFAKDKSERELTGVAIVEFSTSDVQRSVLRKIESDKLKCNIGGQNVDIKGGKSDSAIARDNALRQATDALKKGPRCAGKTVKPEFTGNRGVVVNGDYAFDQPKGKSLGDFLEPFTDLQLP